MVWGMEIPDSFGEFWPRGGYEGDDDTWFNRLDDYFYKGGIAEGKKALLEPALREAKLKYSLWVAGKFSHEPGSRNRTDPPFLPVEPHEVPEFYQTEKATASLGSLIALNFGILAADEHLKAVIERLEPGVHQFFPIEIRTKKGDVSPVSYYILLIRQYFNAFSPADSKEGSYKSYPDSPGYYSLMRRPPAAMSGLAMSATAFGNAHLWRERGLNGALTCISDELMAQIDKKGLRLPKHYKMMEV